MKTRCSRDSSPHSFQLPKTNMPHEETSAALAHVLSQLAKSYGTPEDRTTRSSSRSKLERLTLPGEDTVEKQTLEHEVTALAARIRALEVKVAGNQTDASLPITPDEPATSVFTQQPEKVANGDPLRQRSASSVKSLLTKLDGESQPRQLTDEQFCFLRDHIDQQAREIKTQKETIADIKSELVNQRATTKRALDGLGTSASIDQLKREIEKNAQINATYQKVLREIGTIITAVANGDLSKKVLIHATEKDPEISKFKHTINKMVDQLQEFASQVTHLAKEVGTEGRLGGQASVPGVDGIWAELTENGALLRLEVDPTGDCD